MRGQAYVIRKTRQLGTRLQLGSAERSQGQSGEYLPLSQNIVRENSTSADRNVQ
jgi:hypothetical protein